MRLIAIHDRPASDLCGIHAFVGREDGVNRVYGFRDRERTLTDEEVQDYVTWGDFLRVDLEVEPVECLDDPVGLWVGHDVDERCRRHELASLLCPGSTQAHRLESGELLICERLAAQRLLDDWMRRAADAYLGSPAGDRAELAQLMLSVDHRSWLAMAASLDATPQASREAYLTFLQRGGEFRERAETVAALERLLVEVLEARRSLSRAHRPLRRRPAPFFTDQVAA